MVCGFVAGTMTGQAKDEVIKAASSKPGTESSAETASQAVDLPGEGVTPVAVDC